MLQSPDGTRIACTVDVVLDRSKRSVRRWVVIHGFHSQAPACHLKSQFGRVLHTPISPDLRIYSLRR